MSANNFTLKGKKKMTKNKNNSTITEGSVVTLHYKGTFEDGTEFDSSYTRGEPMKVTAGVGQLISGFDDALQDMSEGDKKTFTVTPDQGYGDRDPEANTTLDRGMFPDGFEFTLDRTIPLMSDSGQPVMGTISEVTDNEIVVDLNHPMAGKTLTFEVEVLSIEDTDG